jgi:hypothetical protein
MQPVNAIKARQCSFNAAMEAFWVLLLVSAFICASLCERVADSKGLKSGSWGAAGFLLGPLALIAVAGMPDKRLRRILLTIANHQGATTTEEEEEEEIASANVNDGFTTSSNASDDEVWSKAISALGAELGQSASRIHSQMSTNAITIKDQSGRIIARASNAANAFGSKHWKFRYKKN